MESGEVLAIATAVYNEHFSGCREWREDLIGEGVLGILVCEQKYEPSKGKFIVYAWRSAWGRMMAWFKCECRHKVGKVDIEDLDFVASEAFGEEVEWDDIRCELGQVRMRKAVHNAIVASLLDGERPSDVAERLGVSRQYVSEVWRRWRDKVAEKFKYVGGNIEPRR